MKNNPKHSFNQEHIIGVICIAAGTIVLVLTRNFPGGTGAINVSGPAFFPNVLSIILIILGAFQLLTGSFGNQEEFAGSADILAAMKRPEFITLLVMTALFIFFIYTVEFLGFLSTTTVFLVAVHWRLGISWVRNLIYTAIFLLVIYLVFGRIFSISLPRGILL